jgi:FkbM family methyltransferase
MKKLIYFILRGTFGKARYFRFYEILRNISLQGLNYKNVDIEKNGELHLIQQLKKHYSSIKPVLFDIGANNGTYSKTLDRIFAGNCAIYCFEPYSKVYKELRETLKALPSVKTFNFGFGNKKEQAAFFSDPVYSELGGLYKRDFSKLDIHLNDTETIQLETLDDFCTEHNIQRIDFLKVDVEGFELNILSGAKKMLSSDQISVIQFEYGAGNYLSKTYLYDFFQLLSPNYRIFKLMKDGLHELKEYHSDYEIHILCYYVAVNRTAGFSENG